jgi:crossover junction endodeoxyribonuclease RuvC
LSTTSYLGVDPGLSGALALLRHGELLVVDMPTLAAGKKRTIDEIELARLIDRWATECQPMVVLEQVAAMPTDGAAGAFSFGRGYGVIRGILRAHFLQIIDVTPVKWKRAVGIPSGAGKDASRALAKELFQQQAKLFYRVKDDGRAEAALMAVYGQKTSALTLAAA